MRLHTAFFGINSLLVATLLISGCSLFKKRNTNAQLITAGPDQFQAPIWPPTRAAPGASVQRNPHHRHKHNKQPSRPPHTTTATTNSLTLPTTHPSAFYNSRSF